MYWWFVWLALAARFGALKLRSNGIQGFSSYFVIQNPFSWCQKDSIFKLLLLAVGTRFVKQGTGVKLGSYCLSFFDLKKWLEFLDGIFQKLVRIQYLRIRSVIKIGHPLLYKLQFLVGF